MKATTFICTFTLRLALQKSSSLTLVYVKSTFVLKDLGTRYSAHSAYFTAANDQIFFALSDDQHGMELWTTDGTPAGTRLVKDINPTGDGLAWAPLVPFGDYVYFTASETEENFELWRSDGSAEGTVQVKDLFPGAQGAFPQNLTAYNGNIYMLTREHELWVTDGTTAGTSKIYDLPNEESTDMDEMAKFGFVPLGEKLLFTILSIETAEPNRQVIRYGFVWWQTDGTTEGTRMLRSLTGR